MRKKGREKERPGSERIIAAGAQEHTIQQDRVLSIKRKTSKKKKLSKEKPLKRKTSERWTPEKQNRGVSKHALGAFGPGADLSCLRQGSAPGPKDGGVRRPGSLVLSSGALLKVSQQNNNKKLNFNEHFLNNYDFT